MKTAVTILFLLLAFGSQSQQWHYGLKADINYAGLRGEGVQSKLNYNFQAGAFTAFDLTKKWSLQGEVLYSQNNYKRTNDFLKYYPNTGKSGSQEMIYLSYIAVPVLLRYHINKMVSVYAGPQIAGRVYSNENLLRDDADAFKKYELSANAGAEAHISFLGIYLRYNQGITDVNNADARYSWRAERLQVGFSARIR